MITAIEAKQLTKNSINAKIEYIDKLIREAASNGLVSVEVSIEDCNIDSFIEILESSGFTTSNVFRGHNEFIIMWGGAS